MKIHFIAIGGAIMHNLAIALQNKGYEISGSDDEIFDPARSILEIYGLLPKETGWNPDKINLGLDAIILGMHARIDNPELIKAQQLKLRIYSFPEYVYEQTRSKKRVVIGGSHGKTTTTSMIMHVLRSQNIDFDYLVGSRIDGFETMVRLSKKTEIAIFEGDEYLSSPLDLRPKFHIYKPQLALLTGIAWDHINVFPSFDNYLHQFQIFVNSISSNGTLIYHKQDPEVMKIVEAGPKSLKYIPYQYHPYETRGNKTQLVHGKHKIKLQVFGNHNMQNLQGAKLICSELGVSEDSFYESISSFRGAGNRLQLIKEKQGMNCYFDFAHSPSKLNATIDAVKEQFPDRKLVAVFELHTFSSLKKDFLPQYYGSMKNADVALVYYSPKTLKHKKLAPITNLNVQNAFAAKNLTVYKNREKLAQRIIIEKQENTNLLFMSSGNFSGLDIEQIID